MASDERTANLLGALALTLAGRTGSAARDRADVAGSDAAALVTLRNYAEGRPLSLLSGALGLSQPGTVRLVDRLERRGFVERHRSDEDARAVGLRLTEAGRRAAGAALAARAGALETALGALSHAERRTLDGLLAKMLAAETTDAVSSLYICRMCDPDACGHPERCPVTQAARG